MWGCASVARAVSIPTSTTPLPKREDGSYCFGRGWEENRYRSTGNSNYEGGSGAKTRLNGEHVLLINQPERARRVLLCNQKGWRAEKSAERRDSCRGADRWRQLLWECERSGADVRPLSRSGRLHNESGY